MNPNPTPSWISLCCMVLLLLTPLAQATEADYHYAGQLVIDPDSGHIRADWQITVYDEAETAIKFVLRDTLGNIVIGGSGVASGGATREAGYENFWAINVELAEPAPFRVISLSYDGVLMPRPLSNRINAIEAGRIELSVDSFWFPIDVRFSKEFTADLVVRAGDGWQGVTTGEIRPVQDGLLIHNQDPRMDIVFTLSKSWHITEGEGFTVYDQRETREGTERVLASARFCRDFLNQRFGREDPLPTGSLLITDRPSSGYARENYIVLTDISNTEPAPLTRFVCHEFAHYWSTGAKFDTVDNWINEAFAEYIGMMAVREQLGDEAFDELRNKMQEQIAGRELPRVWAEGDTERGPYLVQYRKAPLLLAQLEESIGEETLIDWLQLYFANPEKTTTGLLAALETVAGADSRKHFEQMLEE
ncbi:MAG: hypothetical protein HKN15_06535 [Xanthomonadales bacterium]|nr:hypothetical protein [Xanthomonadales bacterium]